MSKKRKIILGVLAAAALIVAVWFWLNHGKVSTDDAQVDGRVHMVSSRVAGYVNAVLVEDNDRVKAGQVLVRLDPSEFQVALAEAKSQLAALQINVPLERSQTTYKVSGAEAGVRGTIERLEELAKVETSAQHDVVRYSTNHAQAMIDLNRMKSLAARGAVSRSQLDLARTQEEATRASLESAKSKFEAASRARAAMSSDVQKQKAEAGLAGTGNDMVEIRIKQYEAQLARVQQAELNLEWTEIKAPVDGYITKRNVEAGKMISRGQPLLALVPLSADDIWVTANFKETEITNMRVGQYAEVKVDAYPGHTFKAEVESLMSGTGAAFSLFPPENASGNYVKVVQRIPVRLRLTDYDPAKDPTLRIGMSVIPTVYVNSFTSNEQSHGMQEKPSPASPQAPATPTAPESGTPQSAPAASPVTPPAPAPSQPATSTSAPGTPPALQPVAPVPAQPASVPQQPIYQPAPPAGTMTPQQQPMQGNQQYVPGNQVNSPSLYVPEQDPPVVAAPQQALQPVLEQTPAGGALTLSPNAITTPPPTSSVNPVQEPSTSLPAEKAAQ